ncbi:hypothetical protein ANME2D_00684 [Candidatus Methanoperedens nitroreducens]|uniref:Uncharacterized protein n=1 Tax=Candidatus Methanoperedens nitratireducens TaxID=1392998 RepID=A0A062VAS0_9EURY|nr:hypothetical protein ANME2D_00684 [Candidatus Methanoperedens nitroreducens]
MIPDTFLIFYSDVGQGWEVVEKYIETQDVHHAKNAIYRLVLKSGVCDCSPRSFSCSQRRWNSPNYTQNAEIQALIFRFIR